MHILNTTSEMDGTASVLKANTPQPNVPGSSNP